MLIFMSYSINFLPIGAVIAMGCDGTDILVKLMKSTVDVVPMLYTYIIYGMLTLAWIYFRIYYFSWWIMKAMHDQVYNSQHYV